MSFDTNHHAMTPTTDAVACVCTHDLMQHDHMGQCHGSAVVYGGIGPCPCWAYRTPEQAAALSRGTTPTDAVAALAEALASTGHVGADRRDVVSEVYAALTDAGWSLTRTADTDALREAGTPVSASAFDRLAVWAAVAPDDGVPA